MTTSETKLTDEVKAMIGVEGELAEASWYLIENEGVRRFTQAVMDPDPRFWDEEYAKNSKFGELVTPPIYVSYQAKTPPWGGDPVTQAFKENPVADGVAQLKERPKGSLPRVPTDLVRNLNAGNDLEIFKYPSRGDRIYKQQRYANIIERVGRDGSHMLIITTEVNFYNQKGEKLCTTRASGFRR